MQTTQTTSLLALFGRLTWMILGPLVQVLTLFSVVSRGDGWLTGADMGYFIVLAAMVLGRWLEFRVGNPQKATGEPATVADLRRYVFFVMLIGLGVWVFANLLGNHWLVH